MKNRTRLAALFLAVGGLGIFGAMPSVAKPAKSETPTTPTTPTTQPAQDGEATGNCTINGTVMKDGKPLANAKVALFAAHAHVKKGKSATVGSDNNNGANNTADNGNGDATTQPSADAGGKKKHDRGDAVATATADENGKFTLTDVPAGQYVVIAGLKGDGRGHEKVGVTSGESTSVEIPVAVAGEKTGGGKKLKKLGI